MNPCLENPPVDEVTPAPETAGGAIVGRGRVLLLDDDAAFEGIIEDFLVENGFTVVAVQNGREGIEAVMGGDFALVLCDMSMPTMPGDMFYRAVERIRPDLCERFIFMTGYRGDASKSDFIKSINGYVLPKPFHLQDLLDSIALTEVRRTFRSVFEAGETAPLPAHVSPPADPYLAKALLLRASAGVADPPEAVPPVPMPPVDPAPDRREIAVLQPVARPVPQATPPGRRGLVSLAWAVAGSGMLLGLFAILASQYRLARDRAAAGSVELLALERKWTGASAHLAEAEGNRRGMEARVNRAKILVAEANAPGLAQALGCVATAATAQTDFREIEFRADPEDPAAFLLRITGVGTGRDPRATADRFRETLELNLKQFFAKAGVSTRFERLEDAPPAPIESATPQSRQVAFTIIATIGKGDKR